MSKKKLEQRTDMFEVMEKQLARSGIKMSKKISSGAFLTGATYDYRTVYSFEDLEKLTSEGFYLNENVGLFLFNAFQAFPIKKGEK